MMKRQLQWFPRHCGMLLWGGLICMGTMQETQAQKISMLDGMVAYHQPVKDLDTSLSVEFKDAGVKEVLKEIESKTGFKFVYDHKALQVEERFTIQERDIKLYDLLREISGQSSLRFKQVNDQINVRVEEKEEEQEEIADITVQGKVTDSSGAPLPGASILVEGTSIGTVTDMDGNYSIEVPEGGALIFSFIGFESQRVAIGNQTTINIQLSDDLSSLDEVVVVGYGTQSTRNVTGSVQQVNTKELEDIPVAQFSQKLQGRLAGVQINQTTGIPGQGMSLRIRGQGSMTAGNQPLYVVDGLPITGDINNINPNEIESITVLKDAASTSLYGSRASNGVVLIETKRAKSGITRVDVNAYHGVQQVPQKGRPNMMNAHEFATFKKELFEFRGQPVPEIFQNPDQYGEGTDWYDALLQTAPIQDYSISLNTGTEKIRTSAVAGFFNQEGVVLNSGFKRYSLRLNSDYKPTEKLNIGFNVAPTYTINNAPNTDGLWTASASGILLSAILTSPLEPHINPDGTLPITAYDPTSGMFGNPNWYRQVQEVDRVDKKSRVLANAFADYEIIDGLNFKTSINLDYGNSNFNGFHPSTTGRVLAAPPSIPFAQVIQNSYTSWLSENLLTYNKTIGDHAFDALAGYTAQKYRNEYTGIYATNFPDDQIRTLNATANTDATSDIQEWSLLSYVGRLNYRFKDRYLLSLAIRRDGSSRFGEGNRWGNFPSVSAGWIISEEPFMPDTEWLSFLKVRGSYGVIGNFDIGNYTHIPTVSTSNYVFNNVVANGRSNTSIGNPMLGWERTKQLDIGLDFHLFNGKLAFTYDFYRKNTSELLYNVNIPLSSGFSNIQTNIGEIKFWGHELTISGEVLNRGLQWNVNANVSFNRNEILALGTENAPLYGSQSINKVGYPMGQFYGLVFEGHYLTEEDLNNYPTNVTSQVGTVRYRDINGDGIITNTNDTDRDIIGDPNPDYIFGLVNNFAYKNFDLSIVASGSIGNQILRRYNEYIYNLDGVFNVDKEVADRWKSPEDPGAGKFGSVAAGSTGMDRNINSRFVYDGSFLTIRNITLGYTMPVEHLKFIRNLRLYASVQQALVFTSYPGNPEVSNQSGGAGINNIDGQGAAAAPPSAKDAGQDWMTYPVPRTFTLGVNIGL